MTTSRHSIGSGFGARSTAADVLRGIVLTGALAVIARWLLGARAGDDTRPGRGGDRVVVPARRREAAQETVGGIAGVEVETLALSDLESVRAFADRFLETGRAIDIMINSAAAMACPETGWAPGWEAQFAVSHLGHYALVNRLRPALEPGDARVVSVSSAGHRHSPIRWTTCTSRGVTTSGRRTGRRRPPTRCSPCSSTLAPVTWAYEPSRYTPAASSHHCSAICPPRSWWPRDGSTNPAPRSTPRSRHPGRARPPRRGRRRPPS